MPKGGKREGAGRKKMPNLCEDAHAFEIELYLRRFIKALGDGEMSRGLRTFVQRCMEMVETSKEASAPYPDDLAMLLGNLAMLRELQAGEEYLRQREAMVHDKGGLRKKVSVLLTLDQMAFLKTIGKGNARRGFRRLDELIYTTLGSIDSVTMAEYPEYNSLWTSYEELFNGYTRTVHQTVGRVPG